MREFLKNPMPIETLSYRETGYFSSMICDYLAEKDELKPFYGAFPKLENFEHQLKLKGDNFDNAARVRLVNALKKQYENVDPSEATLANIELLSASNSFTITTGHQLNLFTGPLYFLYKIFSVINLCERLKEQYDAYNFVPIYWMATEDHDFEEIGYFNLNGKKIHWNRDDGGAVGDLSTDGLEDVYRVLQEELGKGEKAEALLKLFSEAYLKHKDLAAATRYLGNELFKNYGLVIIDGHDVTLKKTFIPYVEMEFNAQLSFNQITETTEKLTALGYAEQVHPREINLFYLTAGSRERIIERDGKFYINNTDLSFSKDELLKEVNEHPERFSPNALLRPLYQEVVLPNLCYIGGGGELAYWFQLRDYFEAVKVPFPVLLLRNSVLLLSDKLAGKLEKLQVASTELFQPPQELVNKHTRRISDIEIDLSTQRAHLKQQFKELYQLAEKTDASFLGAVAAQEKKQLNGLDKLEKRLLKAQRRKLKDELDRLTAIQNALFPSGSLQERTKNFSEFYAIYGENLFVELKKGLDPLVNKFTVLRW